MATDVATRIGGRPIDPTTPPRSRRIILWLGLVALVVLLALAVYLVFLRPRGPHLDLSDVEAVDLALFQSWTVDGAPAYVAQPVELFVADLSDREARDFLQRNHVAAKLSADGLLAFVARTYIVVARGAIAAGPATDAASRGRGFVLVVDPDGTVRYVAIGPPWDTVVPPNARLIPVPSDPHLSDVSRVRAQIELGGAPLVELTSPPGGLALLKIAINPARIPVDPSGTTYPDRTVTLIYADNTGRPRLWLSQSTTAGSPHVPGNPLPFGKKGSGVTHYAWYAAGWGIDGFAWLRAGRARFLTAESGTDLTIDTITQTVGALAGADPTRG